MNKNIFTEKNTLALLIVMVMLISGLTTYAVISNYC